jgi:hypothetical protein
MYVAMICIRRINKKEGTSNRHCDARMFAGMTAGCSRQN